MMLTPHSSTSDRTREREPRFATDAEIVLAEHLRRQIEMRYLVDVVTPPCPAGDIH